MCDTYVCGGGVVLKQLVKKKGDKCMLDRLRERFFHKSAGIDGILVTVGLCIIALVLCVVMKDALGDLIKYVVVKMQAKAEEILSANTAGTVGGLILGCPWIW
jgi:hypothetical protein